MNDRTILRLALLLSTLGLMAAFFALGVALTKAGWL